MHKSLQFRVWHIDAIKVLATISNAHMSLSATISIQNEMRRLWWLLASASSIMLQDRACFPIICSLYSIFPKNCVLKPPSQPHCLSHITKSLPCCEYSKSEDLSEKCRSVEEEAINSVPESQRSLHRGDNVYRVLKLSHPSGSSD